MQKMPLPPHQSPITATPVNFVERRRGYRQSLCASALLRTIATPVDSDSASEVSALSVHLFEYSISGVAFSSAKALPIGTVWRFDMLDKRQINRRIEIRSCRPRHDGMFDIGAMFC